MWKKIFAASAVAVGIVGILGSGSAFADLPWISDGNYTSGQELWVAAWKYDVCIRKNGGYNGDLIVADIYNAYYSKQIAFESFSGDSSCVSVDDVPGGYVRFVTPMGLGNMHYWSMNEDDNSDGSVDLDLSDSTTLNKYMRSYGHTMTRTEKSVATIVFDANGGEGAVPIITGAEAGSSVTLPKNTLTRVGHRFAGWNTKADGTGTSYEDEAVIPSVVAGDLQLFAQWDPMAVLNGGYYVNQKLKKLANPEDANRVDIYYVDNKIKTIKIADSLPSGFDTTNDDNIISNTPSWSPIPIYAWFDNSDADTDGVGDGIIYIYSDADVINASISFGYLFSRMTAADDVSVLAELDLSMVEDVNELFRGATSLTDISPLASWDTSHMVNMDYMFYDVTSLTDISALASWDTSSVKNMEKMFAYTGISNVDALETKQRDGKDYVSWDVSKVKKMNSMFVNTPISDISALSAWDTSSVIDMEFMFSHTAITNTNALETKQHPGKDYVSWDVSKVTNMHAMLSVCVSLADISALASWDVSNVTDMSSLFASSYSLANISSLTSWNTSKVTDMGGLFTYTAITNTDALETKQYPGKDYVSWDVSKVISTSDMFNGVTTLTDISALASWNTSSLEDTMQMFCKATALSDISALANWNTASLKKISGMFREATSLLSIVPLTNWDTSNLEDMDALFYLNPAITDLSAIRYWNTSKVKYIGYAFAGTSITDTNALRTVRHEGKDYVSWDMSTVTGMNCIFEGANSLADVSALESWNIQSGVSMIRAFYGTSVTTTPSWYSN